MIRLHRLSARAEAFYLNPDLIVAIDSTPDTVLTLTTHQKVLVSDAPEVVVNAIKEWRSSILGAALPPRRRSDAGLTLVKATAAPPPVNPDLEEGQR
ncbi:MAG TPA: flagellar FlbD family protein [Solirubrobacter sp.]|nr:flagellar FlbD family protein [Solirubrobacter sp.]